MEKDEILNLLKRIEIKPAVLGGRPIIRGLRFPVSSILEMMAGGMTPVQIIDEHPLLEAQDITASLLYASISVNKSSL